MPNSIWIKVEHGRWAVSFSYENSKLVSDPLSLDDHLNWLREASYEDLEQWVVGVPRPDANPVLQAHGYRDG
jgi:hypothetical protein